MSNSGKERIHYLDIVKGICILLLLVSHFTIICKWAGIYGYSFLPVDTVMPLWIHFSMQCFLIVSGYCSSYSGRFISFAKKQLRQIIIPYIFFAILLNAFTILKDHRPFDLSIINIADHFWFLEALLFARVMIFFFLKISKNEYLLIAVSLCCMIIGVAFEQYNVGRNILSMRQSLIGFFFVSVGYCLRNHPVLLDRLMICSLVVYPIMMCYRHFVGMLPVQDASIGVSIITIPLFLLTSLSGTFFLFKICKYMDKCRILEYFGRNSLIVYCFHVIPYYYIIKLLIGLDIIDVGNYLGAVTFFLLAFLLEVLSLVIFIELLNTKPLKFLIGK